MESFAFLDDWRVALVGLAFFGTLAVRSLFWPKERGYLPGLSLVNIALLVSLPRRLFFSHLSAHPATVGGIWRLISGAILIGGVILLERARRRERTSRSNGSQ